jgi:hypothetical protein
MVRQAHHERNGRLTMSGKWATHRERKGTIPKNTAHPEPVEGPSKSPYSRYVSSFSMPRISFRYAADFIGALNSRLISNAF